MDYLESTVLSYERTFPKSIFIIIFVLSIISSVILLAVPFRIWAGVDFINYWHLFGFGYDNLSVLVFMSLVSIVIVLLINLPLFVLTFQKHLSFSTIIFMRRMVIFGSVLGIVLSAIAMFFASMQNSTNIRYTDNVGFPYVYFLLVIILSAVALNRKNLPKLFSEVPSN